MGGRATVLAALGTAILLAGGLAGAVRAADGVEIATPTASGTLGASISYTDTFQADSAPLSVELLLQEPGVYGPLVTDADFGAAAGGYKADVVDSSHVIPNTTLSFRFRVRTAAGTTLGPSATFTLQDTRYTWQTISGVHVRLHWYSGDQAFAQKALAVGDDAVTRVSALLGVTETLPIDFFVYASADGLDGALGPGTSEFVAGRAIPEIRTLFAEIDPGQIDSSWVGQVIPHELTHLVFDTATRNAYHEPPLWLNEGLAVYESIGYDTDDQGRMRDAVASGALLPLTGLTGSFPTRQELFYLSYAEAVSAVDFFVHTYGQAHLVQLIRSYAQGVTDDQAFKAAAGVDVAGFQAAWLASFKTSLPTAFGPRQPAAGSLPPGWSQSGGGPAASALPTTAPVQGARWRRGPGRRRRCRGGGHRPGDAVPGTGRGHRRADHRDRGRGAPAAPTRPGPTAVAAGRAPTRGALPMSALVARVRRIPSWQYTLGVALLVLGFLITAQLRSLVPRSQYDSSDLPPLRQTAQELQAAQDQLKAQILDLRAQVQAIEQNGQGNAAQITALNAQLADARLAAGLVALQGPGVVISLRDSTRPVPPGAAPGDLLVSAADLRQVIDLLWLSGAEAVSVNGERIAVTTPLTDIGSSVLVNSSYLQPPYQISAIGPADLYTRLATSAAFVAYLQNRAQAVGLDVALLQSNDVQVPAYSGTVNLIHARPVASPVPGGSASPSGSAAP